MGKKNVLGRGLGALIESSPQLETQGSSTMGEIVISQIEANPYQPRTIFNEEALQELSDSIKEVGIIQPITVRKISDNRFQIIAGERRFRASKLAGLNKIPAYIRTAEDEKVMEMALIENIQREDLDAIEISLSYQRLIDEYDLTQEALSEKVGKKRATVANYIRLLKLPALIQMGIRDRKIQMGHARTLLSISDNPAKQLQIYDKIVSEDLSVRKVEDLVRNESKKKSESSTTSTDISSQYEPLKTQLSEALGIALDITCKSNGVGKISLFFNDAKELEEVITLLQKATK